MVHILDRAAKMAVGSFLGREQDIPSQCDAKLVLGFWFVFVFFFLSTLEFERYSRRAKMHL